MKRSTTGMLGVVLVGASALYWSGADVNAYPGTSPSARQAARLKWHPPAGWIRHYLGDDRYKVAGGTWKVVSTTLDTYYHRPSCPNMLRQPAGGVMGFASAADGQEAGYRADPYCSPEYSSFSYAPGSPSAGGAGGGASSSERTTVNRTNAALRITLADGVSTVLLPPNWRRTQSGAANVLSTPVLSDTLRPLRGRGYIRFLIGNAPNGMNAEQVLQPQTLRNLFRGFQQSGQVNNMAASIVDKVTIGSARLGGLSGVVLTIKPGQKIQGYSGRFVAVARGSKIYQIDDEGKGVPGRDIIVKSFQPR